VSKLKRLLCFESQHQSQSDEKSLVQFDYEKAVSNYLGTQSTFNPRVNPPLRPGGVDPESCFILFFFLLLQVLATTPDDFKSFAERLAIASKEGSVAVVASEQALAEANAKLPQEQQLAVRSVLD